MARYYKADDRPTPPYKSEGLWLMSIRRPQGALQFNITSNYRSYIPYYAPALSFVYGNMAPISKAVIQNREMSPTVIVSTTHKAVIQGHIMWHWK